MTARVVLPPENPQAINPQNMTYLMGQDGSINSVPTEYDEKTGENTTATQAPQHGYQVLHAMVDPKDLDEKGNPSSYFIKPDEMQQALQHGLQPLQQYEVQKEAKLAQSKLASGDTDFSSGAYNDIKHKATPGYQSDLGDTIDSKIGNALSLNSSPQVAGIYGAAKGLLSGSKYSLSDLYSSNKDAQQAVLNAQQAQHPLASDISDIVGTSALAVPGAELSLEKQLAINGGLGGAGATNEAVNQNKSVPQALEAGKEGFENSALGTALGIGGIKALGSVGKLASKIAPAFIPDSAPALLKAGVSKSEDYTNLPLREEAENNLADTERNMNNNFENIRKDVGTQKGNELKNLEQSVNPVDKGKMQNLFDVYDNLDSYTNAKSGINTILNDFNTYNGSREDRFNAIKMMQESLGEPVPEYDPKKFTEWNFKNYLNNTASKIDSNIDSLSNEKNNVMTELRNGTLKEQNPEMSDHLDLLDSMQNAKLNLLNKLELDKDPDVQKAAEKGYNRLTGNIESLRRNPNNVQVIDNIKRNLAADVWPSENGTPIPDYGVKTTLQGPSEIARKVLEDMSEPVNATEGYKSNNLGNINIGYKDIKEAQNPKEVFDKHMLNGNDLLDLGKGETMSPITRNKFNNLINFNNDIKNNPSIKGDIKSDLQNLVNNLQDISRKAYLARAISGSKGLSGAVNRLASYGGAKIGGLTQDLKPKYNNVSNFLSPHISPGVQKLMEISPSFRAQMAAAGMGIGSQVNENNKQ